MKSTDRREVVVIGGGIVGCAIALHLADRGVLPVLADTDRPGQGASRRSFASISAFGKDPVSYYELARASMASWSRWAEPLGGNVGLRRDGEVRWAADPGEGRALGERVAQARRWGYPIMPIGEAELRRLLPAAEPGPVAAACHAPYDGQVEPARVLGACHSALQAAGARLLLGRAARFFPALRGVPVERWTLAWRAMPADRLPVVGPLPGLPSLYLAVTHSGVTLAPILGRLVSQEIADEVPDGLLGPFRPGRFAERAVKVLLEVESAFGNRPGSDR